VIFFHSALSSHCFLHRLIPIICKSYSVPAIHLFRGLPLVLVHIGFHSNILLDVLLSSIRITWPSQAILLLFINLTISAFPISSLVHNSFWFSRIHLHFALSQRFFSIFYAQIFWDAVRLDLLTSKPHIRRSLEVLLDFYMFVTLSFHLTLRQLMSYIYGAPILDVSRSHTTT